MGGGGSTQWNKIPWIRTSINQHKRQNIPTQIADIWILKDYKTAMLTMFKDIKDKLDTIFREQESISNDLEDMKNQKILLKLSNKKPIE